VDRIWEAKLRENYAAIVGDLAPKELDGVLRGLEGHLEKSFTCDVQCNVCRGWSPEKLPECPYCGDQGPPIAAEAKPSDPPAVVHQAEIVDDGTSIDAIAVAKAAAAIAGADVVVEEPAKNKNRKKKSEIAEDKKPKAAPPLPAPSAPIMTLPGAAAVASENELDEALRLYREASTSAANSLYHMGVQISRIHDSLWQQRTEGGKPKYKSWSQFVANELTISTNYADRLRSIVAKFSLSHFEKYGAKALIVMAAAPKEDHGRLMDRLDTENLSTRELADEVRSIREKKGITVVEGEDEEKKASDEKPRPRPTKQAVENAAAARRQEKAAVAVGFRSSEGVVKMTAKPIKAPHPHEGAKAAFEVSDSPYGKIECINGKSVFLAIQKLPSGQLAIRWSVVEEEGENE
jgi:hypothetical protein